MLSGHFIGQGTSRILPSSQRFILEQAGHPTEEFWESETVQALQQGRGDRIGS